MINSAKQSRAQKEGSYRRERCWWIGPLHSRICQSTVSELRDWRRGKRCRSCRRSALLNWGGQNRSWGRRRCERGEKNERWSRERSREEWMWRRWGPFSLKIHDDLRVEADGPGDEGGPAKDLVRYFQWNRIPWTTHSNGGAEQSLSAGQFLDRWLRGFFNPLILFEALILRLGRERWDDMDDAFCIGSFLRQMLMPESCTGEKESKWK